MSITLIIDSKIKYDDKAFIIELVLLGILMSIVTAYLIHLINKTFPKDLCDDKK